MCNLGIIFECYLCICDILNCCCYLCICDSLNYCLRNFVSEVQAGQLIEHPPSVQEVVSLISSQVMTPKTF